jgi:hypothetical protein
LKELKPEIPAPVAKTTLLDVSAIKVVVCPET